MKIEFIVNDIARILRLRQGLSDICLNCVNALSIENLCRNLERRVYRGFHIVITFLCTFTIG